jgi:hypothetical protein
VASIQRFFLAQCIYDDESQHEAIGNALNGVITSSRWVHAVEKPQIGEANPEALAAWRDSFLPLAATIKHRGFCEEREWRLISDGVPDINSKWKFRAGQS